MSTYCTHRYKDGCDKMGYHKDDEKELVKSVPITSLTFGAERDFIFRHQVYFYILIIDLKKWKIMRQFNILNKVKFWWKIFYFLKSFIVYGQHIIDDGFIWLG